MPEIYEQRLAFIEDDTGRYGNIWLIDEFLPCSCPDCPVRGHWHRDPGQPVYDTKDEALMSMDLRWKHKWLDSNAPDLRLGSVTQLVE